MSLRSRLATLWRNLVHRDRVDRDLDDELRAAFELIEDEGIRAGLPPERARRAATLKLGHRDSIKAQVREARSGASIDTVLQDVRYGLRLLRRDPLFTMIAALSIALGIGANGAVFSLADALLLRPLPVRDAGAVVTLSGATPNDERGGISYPNYRDLRALSRTFDGLVAYQLPRFSFARSRDAVRETRMGMLVSDNFFDVLGVQPALGRTFTGEEGKAPGRDPVVVLGYDFWHDALAGDQTIVNRVVRINEIDFHVIGVAPASFTGIEPPLRPAFYVPSMMAQRLVGARENPLDNRGAPAFVVKGRLKSGVSRASAQAELRTLWKRLEQAYPLENRNRAITVLSQLEERIRQEEGTAVLLATLATLAAVVLLIACANVGSLLLGRARARSAEMAIRLAIGISRSRLLQQLLVESLLLAFIGSALGLVFAYGAIRFFQTIQLPTDLPIVIAPYLDRRVLLVSVLAGVASALLFGLAPAWQSLKTQLVTALKSAAPSHSRTRTLGRNALVVTQVALSMVLLIATGMLLDGFRKLLVMNPGFRTDQLLMLSLDTSIVRYTPWQTSDFYRTVVSQARELPGVVSVSLTSSIPLDPPFSVKAVIPEGYQFARGQETVSVFFAVISEHYFATMKTGLARGRAFTTGDTMNSRRVAIVNEEFAKLYWPDQDPMTKRVRLSDNNGAWLDIVGVVKTGKYLFIGEPPTPFLFLPFSQNGRPAMSLVVETTSQDAAPLAAPLRNLVRTLDESQPVFNVRTFSSFYQQRAIGVPLLILRIVGTMGLIGLILALIGLYGVVAYSVERRTREIGLRMAIGAARADVLKMVLRQGLVLSIAGIAVGAISSVFVAHLLSAGLVGLGTPNPATYLVVPALVICLTMIASYFPARRAARVDPLRALRYE
jgi:putative ABC transport system permease protein